MFSFLCLSSIFCANDYQPNFRAEVKTRSSTCIFDTSFKNWTSGACANITCTSGMVTCESAAPAINIMGNTFFSIADCSCNNTNATLQCANCARNYPYRLQNGGSICWPSLRACENSITCNNNAPANGCIGANQWTCGNALACAASQQDCGTEFGCRNLSMTNTTNFRENNAKIYEKKIKNPYSDSRPVYYRLEDQGLANDQ